MTTYVVEGRCDSAELARCQLLADRLMTLVPSVTIKIVPFEPAKYQKRLERLARSFPNFSIAHNSDRPVVYTSEGLFVGDDSTLIHLVVEKYKIDEAEPDLEGESLQEALRNLVEANKCSLRNLKEFKLNGPSIKQQAEARTQAIISTFHRATFPPSEGFRKDHPSPNGDCSVIPPNGRHLRGFKTLPYVRIERAIDRGAKYALWSSPYVQKRDAIYTSLQMPFERIPTLFLLDATLPRGALATCYDFRVVLHDEPISRNQLVLVPRDCMRLSPPAPKLKRVCIALVAEPQWESMLPQIVLKCQEKLQASWILREFPQVSFAGADVHQVPADDYLNRLSGVLKTMSGKCVIMCGIPTTIEESQALHAADASPHLCLILGDLAAMPDEWKTAIAGLHCLGRQLAMDCRDVERVAAAVKDAVETCMLETLNEATLQVFRRTIKRNSPLLNTLDWATVTEVLGSLEGLVAFQFFPSGWPDHRRPLDTHLQVFPFPVLPAGDTSPFTAFGLQHFIKRALDKNAVYMRDLPFLHALVRVRPEEPAAACLEREDSDETKYNGAPNFGEAYSQATHIIRMLPNHSVDLANAAQSILVGADFLLLIPHPTPQEVEDSSSSPLSAFLSAFWKQWTPPHPLAFAGGAVGCPELRRAWVDPEDTPKSEAVVFQPLECAAQGGQPETLAQNEGALRRPLAVLSLTCCEWQPSTPHQAKQESTPV